MSQRAHSLSPRKARALGLGLMLVLSLGCDDKKVADEKSGDEVEVVKITNTTPTNAAEPIELADGELRPRTPTEPHLMDRWPRGVEDGDTLALRSLKGKIRLLNVDTEEKFTGDERGEASRNWEEYLADKKKNNKFKYGTPIGERARQFARKFFKRRHKVRLEYQSPKRTKDYLHRPLVYLWVEDGADQWINYNIELVREGLSPYFTKYGYSELYHDQFVEAQRAAREAKKGIWAADARAYPDYDRRLEFWDRRAKQIATFRDNFGERDTAIEADNDDALDRLRKMDGQQVILFGEPDDSEDGVLALSHRKGKAIPLVGEAVKKLELPEDVEFVYARGKVKLVDKEPWVEIANKEDVLDAAKPPKP